MQHVCISPLAVKVDAALLSVSRTERQVSPQLIVMSGDVGKAGGLDPAAQIGTRQKREESQHLLIVEASKDAETS